MQRARGPPCHRERAPPPEPIGGGGEHEQDCDQKEVVHGRAERDDGRRLSRQPPVQLYIDSNCMLWAVFATCLRSESGSGIKPLSARYPSRPQAFSLVNSVTNSLMPGTALR